LKVVYFQRNPREEDYSIEGLFNAIREAMPIEIECKVAISKYVSVGVIRRMYNIFEAYFRQGDINHITGDIHYLSFLLRKKNTILTILDCHFAHKYVGISRYVVQLLWYIIPAKRVSCITTGSNSTKNELLKYINCDESKIKVIHCCVPTKYKFAEKEFNISKPVILQVGTGHNKNLFRLFEALHGIKCRLDLIGKLTVEHKKYLEDFGIEYNNSSNLSENEMFIKYKECDLVAFISTYEGFGMPVLEANTVGRPIITSNVYSIPEVAGNAACCVDPYNVFEIKEGIKRIIEDAGYRMMLINNGRKNIERFTPEFIAKCYRAVYMEMLE